MDENKNNVSEELEEIKDIADNELDPLEPDEEELKKVEEMIRSKSKRKQANSKNNGNDKPKNFIELCKSNIIIPILLLVAVAAIAFGIYYFWPESKPVNTIGITYEQLKANYHATFAYENLFKEFDTELPELEFTTESDSELKDKVDYFANSMPVGFTTYPIAIQGSISKENKEIVGIRFMYQVPPTAEEQEANMSSLSLFCEMIMNSFFPDLSPEEIDKMLAKTSQSKEFEVYGDIAYRFTIQKDGNVSFYALDFASAADNVKNQ